MSGTGSDRLIPIHGSDISTFKSCRRRWLWGSHLNRALEATKQAAPLWFGTAVHHALKDYHGYGVPLVESFMDFANACQRTHPKRLPDDFSELLDLGEGMLNHYMDWLVRRDPLETYVVNGVPQVEVAFEIELPVDPKLLAILDVDKVVYRGTWDRVIIDRTMGALFIQDYKTAARMEQAHLLMDPQIGKYLWAANCIYDLPVAGFIYQQHAKRVPKPARILQNGQVSSAKNQATTWSKYREALCAKYGKPQNSSNEHITLLNALALKETADRDDFIVRTRVTRNAHHLAREGERLLIEVHEMLNPNTPMIPHSGQHCGWCPFLSPCTSLEDGSDWEYELEDGELFVQRTRASSEWEILSHDKLGGTLYRKLGHDAAKQFLPAGTSYDSRSAFDGTDADRLGNVSRAVSDPVYSHNGGSTYAGPGQTIPRDPSDPSQAFLSEYYGSFEPKQPGSNRRSSRS
jgi:hypothetical protein